MAKGYYLVQGDMTTCGGKIVEGASDHLLFGKAIARDRDRVTCGQHPGMYMIAGGIANDTVHGRKMAGTLDSTSSCPCRARFVPSMMQDTYEKLSASSLEPEQHAQTANKNKQTAKGNETVLRNQYGDIMRDMNGNPVYEMEESNRPTKDEMDKVLLAQKDALEKRKRELEQKPWDDVNRAEFKKIFGSDDDDSRQKILSAINKELDINESMEYEKFRFADQNVYAYVSNGDKDHYITIANKFISAPLNGKDSKVVTLCHEMSHFDDVLGTSDEGLRIGGIKLSQMGKPEALESSYNFERYFE